MRKEKLIPWIPILGIPMTIEKEISGEDTGISNMNYLFICAMYQGYIIGSIPNLIL